MLCFNSIKVRLILPLMRPVKRYIKFQFHKGSINTKARCFYQFTSLSFNSIKVRLIPNNEDLKRMHQQLFQFHKGSINTPKPKSPITAVSRFNSIKVRLILSKHHVRLLEFLSFNSIKVRLIPLYKTKEGDKNQFQFHKGSINTA